EKEFEIGVEILSRLCIVYYDKSIGEIIVRPHHVKRLELLKEGKVEALEEVLLKRLRWSLSEGGYSVERFKVEDGVLYLELLAGIVRFEDIDRIVRSCLDVELIGLSVEPYEDRFQSGLKTNIVYKVEEEKG
ncbi:MAG: hypothetical protein ABDH32_08025, partial [Candidatus Caldarchaeales archaeon]